MFRIKNYSAQRRYFRSNKGKKALSKAVKKYQKKKKVEEQKNIRIVSRI
jgi:hypothetical protein